MSNTATPVSFAPGSFITVEKTENIIKLAKKHKGVTFCIDWKTGRVSQAAWEPRMKKVYGRSYVDGVYDPYGDF